MNINNINPETTFGGEWEQIQDTFVYLTISMGYMEDAKAVDLNFKNLALYQLI